MNDEHLKSMPRHGSGRRWMLAAGAVVGVLVGAGVAIASLSVAIAAAVVVAAIEPTVILAAYASPYAAAGLPAMLALRATELGGLVLVGVALVALACALAWWMVRARVPEARRVVRDGVVLTLVAVVALGILTTAIAWPGRLLDGDVLTPAAVGSAVAVGLLGAPIGMLVLWATAAVVRRRRGAAGQIELIELDLGDSSQ